MSAKRISVIIPACNEAGTIYDCITAASHLKPFEIIVVANGCTDATAAIAKKSGCKVLEYASAVGHDVGRAMGARMAKGDILLFLDADFPIRSTDLSAFLSPLLSNSADIVLNNMDPLFKKRQVPHSTTIWRQMTNAFIGRDSLHIDSMLSVPHAMTRAELEQIGYKSLANPILAHILACRHPKLRIARPMSIDVIGPNRYRPQEHHAESGELSRSERRIIGDHLAALASTSAHPRMGFGDGGRRRDIVYRIKAGKMRPPVISGSSRLQVLPSTLYGGMSVSVIIPVQDEEKTIRQVIREAKKIEPLEIIVVVNGSVDNTASIAAEEGITVLRFAERLGNDVGRAVGALVANGDILLFIDGDFVIPADALYRYAQPVSNGIDITFNDLNYYLRVRFPYNIVTAAKYGVNLALDRKDLGIASFIAVPHAVHRKVADHIGRDAFLSPVSAQVKAILGGFTAANAHRTEVDRMNRIRPEEHFAMKGHSRAVERIIGDHAEGIFDLIKIKGERGLFPYWGRMLL